MAFSQSALRARIDLTARELLAISQTISREFAPRYAKDSTAIQTVPSKSPAFSSQELLAISQEISRDFMPRPTATQTSLTLLPIDPRRLYAYWQIAKPRLPASTQSSNSLEKSASEPPLALRVYQQAEPPIINGGTPAPTYWFDIPIVSAQNRQEIVLPSEALLSGLQFCAAIGVYHGERQFTPITYSNYANVPRAPATWEETGLPEHVAQFMLPFTNTSSSLNKNSSTQKK